MTEATETAVADADFDRLVALGQSEADAYAYWLSGTSGEKLSAFARRGLAHSFGFVMDKAATALEAEHAARVKAEGERDGLVRRIRIFERANTEMHRAEVTAEQPRLQRAGDRYYLAKLRLFDRARALLQGEPS